jgi:hypothetical protein
MKTLRYEQNDLNALALGRAHPFQKTVLAYMLERGWQVSCVKTQPMRDDTKGSMNVTVITVSHKDNGGFAGVAPNGLVFRPAKGKNKVEWTWSRMRDLACATIPATNAAFGNLPVAVAA